MSSAAGDQAAVADDAATTNGTNAASSYSSASGDVSNYLSNVNSTLSAGNPYQSKDYLTQQNLDTSGAMNSANTAAQQKEQGTVARTGTNSAALASTVSENARAGQRDMTDYNATRNTENESKWENEKQSLLGDEATGASLESNLYSTSLNGQNSALSTAQQGADAQEQATNGMIDAGIGAVGTAAGGYLSKG